MAGQRLEAQDARAGEGEEMVEVEVAEELGLEVRVAQDVIEESVAASQEEEEKMDVLDSNSCHSGQGDAVAVASDFCDAEQAVEVEVDASAFDFCSGGKEDQAEVHSVEKTEADEQEHVPGEMEVDSTEEELARTEVDEASFRELCPSREEPDLGEHAEVDEVSSQQQFCHSGLEQNPREEKEEAEMDMVEEAGRNQGEEAADFVCCQVGALSEEVHVVDLAMTEIDEATDPAFLHGGALLQDVMTEEIHEATDRAFFHGVALLEELEVEGLAKTEKIVEATDRVICDGGALSEEVKVEDLAMPEINEATPADLCLTRENRQLEGQPEDLCFTQEERQLEEQPEEVEGDTAEEFERTEIDYASAAQFCLSGEERALGDKPELEGVKVDIVGEPARAEVDEATIADVCLGQDDVAMREQPEGIEVDIVGGLASTEVDIARLEHALPTEQEGTSVRPCSQDLDNGDGGAAHAEHGVLTGQVTESQAERESEDNAGQAAEAERPPDLEQVGDTFSAREPETGREPLSPDSQVPVAQVPGREPEQESSTNTVVENEDNCTDMDELAEKPEERVQRTWESDQQVHNVLQEHQESFSATGDAAVTEGNEQETLTPPESETVSIPLHWHPKPCVHISGLGGSVTQEELLPFMNQYVPVASMVFENEKRDAVIVRFEIAPEEADEVVTTVRDALNNTRFKDKTLVVEAFRPDSLLFIGNLTPEIDDESLRKMFEPHGKIERAFVLRNQEGRSKGYGFVEYSLKSQATAAKQVMGNIDMDGRVLRVEWSDCRKVAEMFSTVLFVDRIAKECPNIEDILRTLFGEFGRVRDCHLAIAHEALDGKEVEGSNVRVSFANPSKSAQSYKSRFGNQGLTAGVSGRGFPVMPAMMGAAIRGHMAMPLLAPRFLGPRPCMLGMGLGMQFGGGAPVGPGMIGRGLVNPLLSGGAGMLGPGSIAGMMGRGPGLLLGPVPIPSAAIAQVATAQAKAREEEAKARAEQSGQNYYQDVQYPYQQAYQQTGQQSSIPVPQQQQPQHHGGQQGHQSYASTYYSQTGQQHQIQQQQQQPPPPPPLPQQQQQHQPAYYHQQPQPSPQTSNTAQQQQYNQYAQQYNQQYSQQPYGSQMATQQYGQQQQQNTSSQVAQRTQQEYADLYAQQLQLQQQQQQQPQKQKQQQQHHHNQQRQYQQRHQHQQHHQEAAVAASTSNVSAYAPDIAQPLTYAPYYQHRATAIPGAQTSTSSPVAQQQQSLEAQWAAYYAAQQAAHQTEAVNNSYHEQGSYSQQSHQNSAVTVASGYYQQPTGSDVGQKRSADQMEYGTQTMQSAYTYNQQAGSNTANYQHHAAASDTVYQHQNASTGSSFQQAAIPAVYQHQTLSAGYQQTADAVVYQQPADAVVYQQPADAVVYQQQPSSSYHHQQPAGTYHQSHQGATVSAAVYEYSKRPRY